MIIRTKIKGRNDLDLPEQVTLIYDSDQDQLVLKFDGVIKEFILDEGETKILADIVEQMRIT